MNEALKLLERHSTPAKALVEPAPDDKQLRQILKIALSAPDHGRLHPYRFISIRGEARHRLSEIFGKATQQRDADVEPAYLQKQMDKPLSAGAAAHNVLLAANALGFGSIWLTGANAYDKYVCSELGLDDSEHIIGFIYIGTPTMEFPPRPIPEVSTHHRRWE